MKKALCYIAFTIFLWTGLYLALIADVTDDSPLSQGGLCVLAVIAICVSILFMAKGNELPWKAKK